MDEKCNFGAGGHKTIKKKYCNNIGVNLATIKSRPVSDHSPLMQTGSGRRSSICFCPQGNKPQAEMKRVFRSQDSVCERAQRVPEVEAGCGGRLGPGVCPPVGVRPPLRRLWRRLHLLRLQRAAVSRGQRGAPELRRRPRRPALPVRRVLGQSGQNHQVPEQRQSAAVHR